MHHAIICNDACGPHFYDLYVMNGCNTGWTSSTAVFGVTYENDTGIGGAPRASTFFTGATHFTVAEVEVFEISN
jgi:hypothetical protein